MNTIVQSGAAVTNPSSRSTSSDRLRRRMGTHLDAITEPTHLHEIENGAHTQSVGVGVTDAALDVFSNFLEQVIANVAPPSEITTNVQPQNPPPRRSKRFATRQEGGDNCALTLPALPQPLVRSRRGPRVQQRWAPVRVSFESTVIGPPASPRAWVPAGGHACPSSGYYM